MRMRLEISNSTGCLNDYFFQMLCLLYFPGEKFSVSAGKHSEREPFARFVLTGGDGRFLCCCTVQSGDARASANVELCAGDMLGETDDEYVAQSCAGSAFLNCCRKIFGFDMPWGRMTGLRPVKRMLYYLVRGRSVPEAKEIFRNDFAVSEEKTELCADIALYQQRVFSELGDGDCALYVAIPFCPSRCTYCSFVSYSGGKLFALLPDYLERLKLDITRMAGVISGSGKNLVSVYIGGGTPTVLDAENLASLLGHLTETVDMSRVKEFTLEGGRPDTVTAEKLRAAQLNGVTRISINTQTTDDNILAAIGRKHTAADYFVACDVASAFDFDVNTDLIAGLPGDTEDGFARSLGDVMSRSHSNITVHTMSVKNAAPIRFIGSGAYDPRGSGARNSVRYARDTLAQAGYLPYYLYRQKNTVGNAENTGYTKPGKHCLYNVMTMEERHSIFAVGASALTKIVDGDLITRFANPKYPFEYLASDNGALAKEILTALGKV